MLPILLATLIFTYFIYAAHVLDLHRPALEALCKPVGNWFGEAGNPVRAGVWAGASVVSLMAWLSPETSFLGEMRGEITGMAITVIVIDELVGYRNRLESKQEIFEKIESPVRDVAVESMRLIQKYGWLDEIVKLDKLQFAHLEGANLRYANLSKANLREAHLERAKLKGANLKKANLHDANLEEASLTEANLEEASLTEANMRGTKLKGANLKNANLSYANLQGVDLSDANLQGTNLAWANLQMAYLYTANLQDARYNIFTIFPDGFDPVAAGAIKVDDAA